MGAAQMLRVTSHRLHEQTQEGRARVCDRRCTFTPPMAVLFRGKGGSGRNVVQESGAAYNFLRRCAAGGGTSSAAYDLLQRCAAGGWTLLAAYDCLWRCAAGGGTLPAGSITSVSWQGREGVMQHMTASGAVLQAAEHCWQGHHIAAGGSAAAARLLLQRGRGL